MFARESGQSGQVSRRGRCEPVHDHRQPTVIGGRSQNWLDAIRPLRRRGQLTDTPEAPADDLPLDSHLDLLGRLIQPDLAEADEAIGVRRTRRREFLPRGPVAVRTAGTSADRLVQHAHLAPEGGQIGGPLGMRQSTEEHRAVHSCLVQQGDVTVHGVVDMAVRIDDQRILLVRTGVGGGMLPAVPSFRVDTMARSSSGEKQC